MIVTKAHTYRQCPKCGNSPLLESEAKFCFRDGTKLIAKAMQCMCGSYLDFRNDKFCEFCGASARNAQIVIVEL